MASSRPALTTSSSSEIVKDVAEGFTPSLTRDKRQRRIRRACDDCRGRKIKCDGKYPCLSCAVARKECTYNSNPKSRYGGPMYIEELEERITTLEQSNELLTSLLADVFPDVDIENADMEEKIRRRILETKIRGKLAAKESYRSRSVTREPESPPPEELLDTMIEATGRLHITDQGHFQYHGDGGGIAVLHQIGEHCSRLLDDRQSSGKSFFQLPLHEAFTADGLSIRKRIATSTYFSLPPKATAQTLVNVALDASSLMKFLHRPSFDYLFDRMYSFSPEQHSPAEESFLPLLYIILAIGELWTAGKQNTGYPRTNLDQTKGVKWFRACQSLLDTANCRDITSLQAIIGIIIYLQSSALMHSCYSYISIATSVSLQMGLHRSAASRHLDPIQQEVRKRIFWVIQTMETYVTTLLGLPTMLRDEDVDQELPLCIDDEFITSQGIVAMPVGSSSSMTPVNAHSKLLQIMRNLVKDIYPRVKQLGGTGRPYRVKYHSINRLESELEDWFNDIPVPTEAESLQPNTLRTQLLLRLAYAHVQMVLYRPFIHHIVRNQPGDLPEMRSYACASACIKAAMQIVWIVEELDHRGLLVSAYWFTVYITFFAVMALCMFIIGNPEDPTVDDTFQAADKGRNILSRLSLESASASKCVAALSGLFEQVSNLCMERRQSRDQTASNSSTISSQIKTAPSKNSHDYNKQPLQNPAYPSSIPSSTAPISPASIPLSPNFQFGPSSTHSPYQDLQHQGHPGLLAMMGPPLEGFQWNGVVSAPLTSPMHGILGVGGRDAQGGGIMDDVGYFPYFTTD